MVACAKPRSRRAQPAVDRRLETESSAMKLPRVRSRLVQLMIAVVVSAIVSTRFRWSSPESSILLVPILMLLVLSSPFLLDHLETGRPGLGPRGTKPRPLPRLLRLVTWPWPDLLLPWRWPDPPHRRKPTRDRNGDAARIDGPFWPPETRCVPRFGPRPRFGPIPFRELPP